MDKVINLRLMSHPANWVLVTLMAYMFALTLDLITKDAQ